MNNQSTIKYQIRPAEESDFEAIITLQKEFAIFQKTPDKMKMTADQMKRDKYLFQCFVAQTNDTNIIGFVTFFPAYYSWSGKAIYIDDLYVTEPYRKFGIGKQLLDTVIFLAKESDCKKVRWQVSDWNTNAIDFYKKLGADMNDTERNCDLIL